jgi:hypothetical protein
VAASQVPQQGQRIAYSASQMDGWMDGWITPGSHGLMGVGCSSINHYRRDFVIL